MATSTIPILLTKKNGTFFNSKLLHHIILGTNNDGMRTILQDIRTCHLTDSSGNTLLHIAAKYGNSEIARHLIELGADVNAQDRTKRTPIMLAIEASKTKTVQVLLRAAVDIFVPDVNGHCVLDKSLNNKNLILDGMLPAFLNKVTVESLKSSKQHISSEIFHRGCPLYHFMQLNNAEVTEILLENGSPVNVKNPLNGETALHLAVKLNCFENVKLLLQYNANVDSKNGYGRTPFDYVFVNNNKKFNTLEMIKLLTAAGAAVIDPVSRQLKVAEILSYGTRAMVRTVVLQCSIDMQFKDIKGKTVLHYLAENRCPNIFEELPNLDFDINIRCISLRTPLHYAATVGNASSIKFLLDCGADINAKCNHDKTPLFLAVNNYDHSTGYFSQKSDSNDYLNCIEIFLERGADPCIYTEHNVTFTDFRYPEKYNFISKKQLQLIMPILAKLVLMEACGREIQVFIRNLIERCPKLKSPYDSLKAELPEMKEMKITDSITLFDFLTINDNQFYRFTRYQSLVSNLSNVIKGYNSTSYYHRMLNRRFLKFSQLVKWRESILPAIKEVLSEFCNLSLNNIAEEIIDFLHNEKLKDIV